MSFTETRQAFIDFVNWYNKNASTIQMTPVQRASLIQLHSIWKDAKESDPPESFFKMKELHSHLSGIPLFRDKDSPWTRYIVTGQKFRLTLLDKFVGEGAGIISFYPGESQQDFEERVRRTVYGRFDGAS